MPRPIAVDEIEVGDSLRAAILDGQGRELMPAGRVITKFRLRKLRGARELFLADEESQPVGGGESAPAAEGRLDQVLRAAAPGDAATEPSRARLSGGSHAVTGANVTGASVATATRANTAVTVPPAQNKSAAGGTETVPAEVATQVDSKKRTIAVSQFRVGMRLRDDIHDQDGVLLLAGGAEMTDRFLQLLYRRELEVVELRGDGGGLDPAPPDVSVIESALQRAVLSRIPLLSYNRPGAGAFAHLPQPKLKAEVRRGLSFHQEAASEVEVVYRELQSGLSVSAGDLQEMFSDFANYMTMDADLLALVVGGRDDDDEYLFNHGVDVALISMAIAGQMGLPQNQMAEIGLGAMLHDVGMLSVPAELRLADRQLTPAELKIIQQHPLHTLELLERVHDIPMVARTVAFQVHERCDGSGYPRGRKLTTIHPFARIVSIADQYAAMVRPRPYREEHLPHHSVRDLLHAGAREQLDRSMLRAFVDRFSVFPVGSKVMLDKGFAGQVIRSNVGMHTQPVVVELDAYGKPTGQEIDLSKCENIKIAKPGPLLSEKAAG